MFFSSETFLPGVEGARFYKDFEFSGDTLRVWGTDFDFAEHKYIRGYDKTYRF